MSKYTLGLDFGTRSARAVLVDVATGERVATAVHAFADGVIDETLPGSNAPLPPAWALQNPADWLAALEAIVPGVIAESRIPPESVVGLGLVFTACTILPTTTDGTPFCTLEGFQRRPHAWPKLWKHHAAQPQAGRVNALASARGERWLARYASRISSESVMPKALQMLEEAPDLYAAADYLVEGGDWMVWQLTGTLVRNACAAGYKATWHKAEGYPSTDFLAALHPELAHLYSHKLAGPVVAPGQRVGVLRADWAERLGLAAGTPVAASMVDGHAAVPGGGVNRPGTMLMVMGTSIGHMLLAENELLLEGISAVVQDGIMPGLFGYEAGQAGAGDMLAWFVAHGVPPVYHEEAAARGWSLHDLLTEKGAAFHPGQSGLLALDWWNGNRSTLMDADLSGLIVGCTLGTRAEEIYRALIEAMAFGTRVIIETFTGQGIPIGTIVTGGSLTQNPMLMQIYADVTSREMAVSGAAQASAQGAAMLGAVAAGKQGGGYDSLSEAVDHMALPPQRVYRPIEENLPPYNALYREYRRLYDYFGRGENEAMKALCRLRKKPPSTSR